MDRLISEQAVLKAVSKGCCELRGVYARCEEGIKAIPSAEPKTVLYSGDGYADGYMVFDMAECPNCGRKFEYGDETWNCNFCPDCGQELNWERSDKK